MSNHYFTYGRPKRFYSSGGSTIPQWSYGRPLVQHSIPTDSNVILLEAIINSTSDIDITTNVLRLMSVVIESTSDITTQFNALVFLLALIDTNSDIGIDTTVIRNLNVNIESISNIIIDLNLDIDVYLEIITFASRLILEQSYSSELTAALNFKADL